jgi:plasmid maintenance system antidote protein VapI
MAKDNNANKRESRLLSEEIRDLNRENYDIVKDTYDIQEELKRCLYEQNEALRIQNGIGKELRTEAQKRLESQKKSKSASDDLTQSIQQQAKEAGKVKNEFNSIEKQLRGALNVASDFSHALGFKDLGKGFDLVERVVDKLSKQKKIELFGDIEGAYKKAGGGMKGGMRALQVGFKKLGPIVMKALGPIALVALAAKAIKALIDASFEASRQTADLTRNQLISRDLAREMYTTTIPRIRDEYNLANAKAGIHGTILKKDILNAQKSINDELGFQVNLLSESNNLINQNVADAAGLVKHMGLSSKATNRLFIDAARTNQELDEMVKSLSLQLALRGEEAGLTADIRKILHEAASITGRLRANFKGSVVELAKAVFEAKLLGLSLSQVDKTSSSLLDFQSSITAEMEAEVLLGRDLNLEQARFYALTNQTDKLAKELAKNIGTQGEFLKLNRIEQDALAKSMGMSVDEVADMLQKQEDQAFIAKKLNELRKEGMKITQEDIDAGKVTYKAMEKYYMGIYKNQAKVDEILKNEVFQRMKTTDAQQRFNEALESAKEQFTDFVSGGSLDKLATALERLVSGTSVLGKMLGFGDSGESEYAQKLLNVDAEQIRKANKVADILTLGQTRLLRELYQSVAPVKVDETEDFIIRPGQPVQKFRKDDIVIGGTNLMGDGKGNKEVLALLGKIHNAIEKGSAIYVDGKMVGQSLAQTTSKLG